MSNGLRSKFCERGAAGYDDNRAHLAAELAYVDQLLRAETVRWRRALAPDKTPDRWGMLEVSEGEVDAYLKSSSPVLMPEEEDSEAAAFEANARRLRAAIEARLAQTPTEVDLRLRRLVEQFSVAPEERDALLVCFLVEQEERYRRLVGYLQDDAGKSLPSIQLLAHIVDRASFPGRWFAPDRTLFAHDLVRVAPAADGPLGARLVRLNDRIARFLEGDDAPDPGLLPWLTPVSQDSDTVLLDEALPARLEAWSRAELRSGWLLLSGPPGSGRRTVARRLAERLGRPLLVLDAGRLVTAPERGLAILRLALREARLRDAVLLAHDLDPLLESAPALWQRVLELLRSHQGLVVLTGETLPEASAMGAGFAQVRLVPPTYAERCAIWECLLPVRARLEESAPERKALAAQLAGKFQFTPGRAADALAAAWSIARLRAPAAPRLKYEDLLEGSRRQSGQRLLRYGVRIEPREEATFDDLVLPPAQARQIAEVRDRIRLRHVVIQGMGFDRKLRLGRGFVALFAGPSGVGKTMAAELLAKEQGVDLYKVDLAQVVSKWVGETEKHLAAVFAEARALNAIIFFDEADALFGKRGEVKDARDRWANVEINHLLQEVETHDGVIILASNLRQNIDAAFLRRIQAIVDFPVPGETARFKLWRGALPEDARPPDAELRQLAERLKLTGGDIKNIAIDAAFRALAAREHEAESAPIRIGLRHLVAASGREYQKLGRPINESEFGMDWHAWLTEDLFTAPPREVAETA
jgi:AAA+ superfamily predicted ATPase